MEIASLNVMPEEAAEIVRNWLGAHYEILHVWEGWEKGDAYRIVAKVYHSMYFLRVFQVGDQWELSQDRMID